MPRSSAGNQGDFVVRDSTEGDDTVFGVEVKRRMGLREAEEGLGHDLSGVVDYVFVHVVQRLPLFPERARVLQRSTLLKVIDIVDMKLLQKRFGHCTALLRHEPMLIPPLKSGPAVISDAEHERGWHGR